MNGILVLEDGSIFHGTSLGVSGYACGEVVFNTAMTGYQEILSDPSYAQQIINFTCPHIGNVGVNREDAESSRLWATGIILRQFPSPASNWRSEQSLIEYIKHHSIVGIADIDTRFLTQKLRDQGSLIGCIMTENMNLQKAFAYVAAFKGLSGKNLASIVSTKKVHKCSYASKKLVQKPYQIAAYDFGIKNSILDCLSQLGCNITIVPSDTDAEEVIKMAPEGILLSNGPGDPMACHKIISNIEELLKANIPIFGICLGHQLLALAEGANSTKMKFGHHGANHPVQHLETGNVMITSQNHGFTIEESTLPPTLYVTHRSLFDGSLQGFRHKWKPIYGFQGHPEASPGPHDAKCLFLSFISDMKIRRKSFYKSRTYDETYGY